MPEAPKRTINAKLILQDIQAGVNESEIKRKFKLSDKGYQSVLGKLSVMGLMKEPGPSSRKPVPKEQPDLPERNVQVAWRCPSCGTPQTRAYDECPSCGIIASKAAAIHSPGYRAARSYEDEVEEKDNSLSTRWPAVIVSVLVCLVIGAVLLKWASPKRTAGPVGTNTSSNGSIRTFTEANFQQEVKDASKTMPVLVMFYADW